MPDTPFDSTVTIAWDVTQPIQGLLDLHSSLGQLDRELKQSVETAGSWAVSFMNRIGLVHDSFQQVIADIQAMKRAMDQAGQAPPGSLMASQAGAVTNYRLPDVQTAAMPAPPGISQADWQWFLRQQAQGAAQGGISPTVAATSSWRMSLDQGYGQNWPGFEGVNPFGAAAARQSFSKADIQEAQDAYFQFRRYELFRQQAGLGGSFASGIGSFRDQAALDQEANFAAQRLAGQGEYAYGMRYGQLWERAGLGGSFEQNLGALRGQAAQALPGIMDEQGRANVRAAREEYQQYYEQQMRVNAATKANTDANEANRGSLEQMGNSVLRHIGYIAQAIVIWGAFQAAQQFLKQMVTDMQQLEATSARLSFINPSISAGVQYASAGRYGVGMAEAAPGILAGAQFGAGGRERAQAGQLAEIFGAKEYTNALQELMQTERRANDAGIAHVNVMGYIATAYKTVPGDMESYFDALQQGITLSTQLGLTAEQTGLMLQRTATTLEISPEQVATVLERVQLRLMDPKTQDILKKQFGISGTDEKDLMRNVAAYVAQGQAGSEGLTDFLAKGLGLQGARSLLEMTTALTEFNKTATETAAPLENINTLTDQIDKTGTQAFARLKASADAFLASLISIEGQKEPLQVLMDALNPGDPGKALGAWYQMFSKDASGLAKALQDQSNLNAYQAATGKNPYAGGTADLGPLGKIADFMAGPLGGLLGGPVTQVFGNQLGSIAGIMNFLNPNKDQSQYTPEYRAWLANQTGGGPGEYDRGVDRSMAASLKGLPSVAALAPPNFGGFQDLPKNFDWDKFQVDLKKYSAQLAQEVPNYQQDPQEVAFWDASKGYYRTAVADSQVIQRALQEQTDTLKQITGVFNVPATGEVMVPFFALQAGMVPSTDPRARRGRAGQVESTLGGGGGMTNEERNRALGIDPNYIPGGLDAAQQGVMGYLRAHGYSASGQGAAQAGRLVSPTALDSRSESIQQHREAMAPVVQVSMRNTVVLNSRIIYDEMVHQMQAQLHMARRGVGGGAGSQYVVG